MANPENKLRFFGNGTSIGIGIGAESLSNAEKRGIVRYLIFTTDQTEILIAQDPDDLGKIDVITSQELANARNLSKKGLSNFLRAAAARMKGEIVVKSVAGQPQEDPDEKSNSVFREFIDGEMKGDI